MTGEVPPRNVLDSESARKIILHFLLCAQVLLCGIVKAFPEKVPQPLVIAGVNLLESMTGVPRQKCVFCLPMFPISRFRGSLTPHMLLVFHDQCAMRSARHRTGSLRPPQAIGEVHSQELDRR